jgi:hypothetical protein
MIVPDHAHLPQSIAEWEALVDAVGEATDDTRAEKTWLELKGRLDLGSAEGRFTVAKAILAMANRDPAAAAASVDGRGLVLLGAEAGSITGLPRVEDHVLKEKLAPYLGQDDVAPRWDTKRVQVSDSNDVLIIIVAAPQAGDPIYTLRRPLRGRNPSRASMTGRSLRVPPRSLSPPTVQR